ncbi:MAG TPA: hypothetical protein VGF23_05485 [Gaiellaceae bacterium]|jgi:Flp pilus assembly pilin Flp
MVERLNAFVMVAALSVYGSVRGRLRREEGQSFVEYALVLMLIVVAGTVILAVGGVRQAIIDALTRVKNAINGQNP